MDRKLQRQVLMNGPDKNSQEQLDCAAWLIKHGFADGQVLPDNGRPGNHAYAVNWNGITPSGEKLLSGSISKFFNSPWISSIGVGLIVGILLFFIAGAFEAGSQSQAQESKLKK